MITNLQVFIRAEPPLFILELVGDVTTLAEESILAAYQTACEQGAQQILLSFGRVTYLNSAGIAVIISLLAEARQRDQQVLVCALPRHYAKVFHEMGLDAYIRIFATEDDARRSARADG